MSGDDDLTHLRLEVEREALTVALQMLRGPATSATARANVVRGVLSDAAARRHDQEGDDKEPHQKSLAELRAALARRERQLAPLLIEDAEIVEPAPAGTDVFD